MIRLATFFALVWAQGAIAQSEPGFATIQYRCDRYVTIPATYADAGPDKIVVLHVDGQQITLIAEPSEKGQRYGWPSDGASYVWSLEADQAVLSWREAGVETLILHCKTTS
jgi:membrane-bound inhibitor of C-type lysozyme